MSKTISITILILLTYQSLVISQDIENVGYLSIDSEYDVEIFLNNVLISNSPFTDLALTPGIYIIQAYFINDRNWLNRGVEKKIEIESGGHKSYLLSPQKLVFINSDPYDSKLYCESKLIGNTPIIIDKEQYNRNILTLHKDGYEKKSFSLDSKSNELFFNLNNINGMPDSHVLKSGLDKNNFKWLKEGIVILSVVSSWASFYFKREADSYFDKSELYGANPQLSDEYYNKSLKYDTLSHIAIGTSIVSLGTYLYLLLSE